MATRSGHPRRILAAVLCGLIALSAPGAPPASGQEPDPDDLEELDAARDEILGQEAALIDEIEAAERRHRELTAELGSLNAGLRTTEAKLARARSRLERAEAAEAAAERALAAAKRRVRTATRELRDQAVASYVAGGRLGEDMLSLGDIADGDIDDTVRNLEYAGVVVDHQNGVLDDLKTARRDQRRRAEAASAARAEAGGRRDAVTELRDGIEADRDRVAALERQAAREKARKQRALGQLLDRKAEIELRILKREQEAAALAAAIRARQAGQAEFEDGAISFVHPLPAYDVGGGFGMRHHPILDYERLHAGVDLGGRTGEEILASADGVVVSAGPRGGYGNAVVIDHGQNLVTVSAHMSAVVVEAGDRVSAGDVIGAVGSTGLSTGPHLHFETRVGGEAVDPESFIDFTPSG